MNIVRTTGNILFVLFTSMTLRAQPILFTSDAFTVASNKVVQGKFTAFAASRTALTSNYQSDFKRKTPRDITFKFSINGLDNERMPGQDHRLNITPVQGKASSPIFTFGKPDPEIVRTQTEGASQFLEEDTDVLIRVDMRNVLNEFETKGFFTTFTGETIAAADFHGVYIAGNTDPLSWNFAALASRPDFKLQDLDGDGIYEQTIHFKKETYPGRFADTVRSWRLVQDISEFPRYESPHLLVDALYNKSLEEMVLNVRDDGAFMAGEMWPGVWTRDLSYSILLSFAIVHPDAAKASLLAKVKNDRIIQDTGTGGSWPVSTDRMVWALAAWEVYLVTGDHDWLKKTYSIIKNSAHDDRATAYDPATGLFYGESSFLDWREQTYPRWMDPKDIYTSKNLGTNAVHYQTYRILAQMAQLLGEESEHYSEIARSVKQGMNAFLWNPEKGYYGQYLYGRTYSALSPRSESLGEALAVLFDISGREQGQQIIRRMPVTTFGVPCIYPQIPHIPPYHNNAVWPFVAAYWGWASAKAENTASVSHALATITRAAALFLTNKENLVASTGDFMGTEINSSRQLWSVAGNLAMIYRVIFGMSFTPDSLLLHPFIPKEYEGARTLRNVKYRNSVLDITIHGYGNMIQSVVMDGKQIARAAAASSLTGQHTLVITMSNSLPPSSSINVVEHHCSPETPMVSFKGTTLRWSSIAGAEKYSVFKNAKNIGETTSMAYDIPQNAVYAEYQVMAVDDSGLQSFLSEPIAVSGSEKDIRVPAGEKGDDFVRLYKNEHTKVFYTFEIPCDGTYAMNVQYANGSGPINTDNKCALRTAEVDGKKIGTIVMPQRGENNWKEWGLSNSIVIKLTEGEHVAGLLFTPSDNNMNAEHNSAFVKEIRFSLLEKDAR